MILFLICFLWLIPLIILRLFFVKNLKDAVLFAITFIKFKLREFTANIFQNGLIIRTEETINIVYYLNDTQYQICTPITRGIRDIKGFDRKHNEKNENHDKIFNQYLGPFKNFHGIPTTPKMLGFNNETLIVHYRNGTKKEFGPDQIIDIFI